MRQSASCLGRLITWQKPCSWARCWSGRGSGSRPPSLFSPLSLPLRSQQRAFCLSTSRTAERQGTRCRRPCSSSDPRALLGAQSGFRPSGVWSRHLPPARLPKVGRQAWNRQVSKLKSFSSGKSSFGFGGYDGERYFHVNMKMRKLSVQTARGFQLQAGK